MKLIFNCLVCMFFLSPLSRAQTSISGIINDYVAVEAIDPCLSAIEVTNATAFQIGDRVLLIQMQGASIATDNNSSFGTISDMGSAGLYEKGAIADIMGNTIFLENTLVNDYNISGKVQLVRVPIYENANIDGLLTGKAWDGETGGIVAFEVVDQLTFSSGGEIDAEGLGFRGGIATTVLPNNCSWINPQNDYSYNLNTWRAAEKGEGIAEKTTGQEAGKGPQANGGGGGNDHNSGGGGGANLSAGGKGGTNEEPSNFGCQGNHPGLGGRGLTNNTNARLFMGGGGGAGHGNNSLGTNGGHGGGIVFITANTISANDPAVINTIRISGQSVPQNNGDGAGGAGAGGTVLIKALNVDIAGELKIEARGGEGGTVGNNNQNRCFGPGGGGAGGVVLKSGIAGMIPNVSININGGASGMSINSNACSDSPNGATAGAVGSELDVNSTVESATPNNPLEILTAPMAQQACVGESITFTILAEGIDIAYQWQIDTGSGFQNIINDATYAGAQTATLSIDPVTATLDGALFRCTIANQCFGNLVSTAAVLMVIDVPTADFAQVLNGNTATFTNLSTAAISYLWDFGDGQTSTAENPMHTYAMDGNYLVQLTVTNACGSDTYEFLIVVATQQAPIADFTFNIGQGCAPLEVQFSDLSTNDATDWLWTFPGGIPATSTETDPLVRYDNAGTYDVILKVSNASGENEIIKLQVINVEGLPTADFAQVLNGNTATFTNLSTAAVSYLWDFGDGQTSTAENPMHTYAMDGNYLVQLTVTNACGSDTYEFIIVVSTQQAPIADFTFNIGQGCAPLEVQFSDLSTNDATDWLWTFSGGIPATSTEINPQVRYETPGLFDVILQVSNASGENEIVKSQAIKVDEFPTAAFSYLQDAYTFSFTNNSQNASGYFWDFGDGSSVSTAFNPTHTYTQDGIFQVTLMASNASCSAISTLPVNIFLSGVEEEEKELEWLLFPNPVEELLFITSRVSSLEKGMKIYSSAGVLIEERKGIEATNWEVDVSSYAPGIYFFQLSTEQQTILKRVVVF